MISYTDGIKESLLPKIWVGDRETYAAGGLRGEWINLAEERDEHSLRETIDELLRKWSAESGEKIESWFVAASENLPWHSENPSLKALMGYVEMLERHDSGAVRAFYELVTDIPADRADAESDFESAYIGHFEDEAELGRYLLRHDIDTVRNAVQSSSRYDPHGASENSLDRIVRAVDFHAYGRRKLNVGLMKQDWHVFRSDAM